MSLNLANVKGTFIVVTPKHFTKTSFEGIEMFPATALGLVVFPHCGGVLCMWSVM